MLYVLDFEAPGRAPEARMIEVAWGAKRIALPLWKPGPYARRRVERAEKLVVCKAADMKALASIEVASLAAVQTLQLVAHRRHGAAAVWIEHGNADPRYVAQWLSPRGTFEGTVACMGLRSLSIYRELLPNGRCVVTGYPGMGAARALRCVRKKVASPSDSNTCDSHDMPNRVGQKLLALFDLADNEGGEPAVLVISSPGWNRAERVGGARALADAVRCIVALGCRAIVRPKNRLDRGAVWGTLGPALQEHALVEWAPYARAGALINVLARPDVVACIGVESTALLEAACAGLPTARIDYTGRPPLVSAPDPHDTAGPWWSRWVWEPRDRAELQACLPEMLSPTPAQLARQDEHLDWMVAPALVPDFLAALS